MNDPSNPIAGHDDPQNRLHESKERAVDAASDAAEKVRNVAQECITDVRDRAENRYEELRGKAESTVAEARDTAQHRTEEGMTEAGSGLKKTASRLRDASGELSQNERWLGATLEQAASVADRAGEYLSGQNLNNVVSDAQDVARRRPAAFMGGAAALGFALARVGKVTAERATGSSRAPQPSNGHSDAYASYTAPTHASTDKNRTTTNPTATTGASTVTRPTDGRDVNTVQSTPLHRSQA